MRKINANGMLLPILGQGGWTLGDDPSKKEREIDALRYGIEIGLNMIDTAEMYGEGASESLIGEAISGIEREEVILVSKVYPHNSGRDKIFTSCDHSLLRLGVDYVDLYLLHWRGEIPLAETVECMEELVAAGKIRRWGVSNFDVKDMEELFKVPGGERCAVDQVMYNVGSRGIEYDLIPWSESHSIGIMAYEPLLQSGKLVRMHPDIIHDCMLSEIAEEKGISVHQLMLAFVLRKSCVAAIPGSSNIKHIKANRDAAEINLTKAELDRIDEVFLPPTSKMHLDVD